MTIRLDAPPIPLDTSRDGPLPIAPLREWLDSAKPAFESVRLEPVPADTPDARVAHAADPASGEPALYLPAACLARTAQIDSLIAALAQRAHRRHATASGAPLPCVIAALGSYGRRELCPCSDIDLLFLHEPAAPPETLKALIGAVLTPLWDCGLTVTQVVYAPADIRILTRRLMALEPGDPAAEPLQKQWTSLLDARPLAIEHPAPSDAVACVAHELRAALAQAQREFRRDHAVGFARHKAREIAERRGALHIRPWEIPAPEYLEPNLKDGLGGLRDALAAQFIEQLYADDLPSASGAAGAGLAQAPGTGVRHARAGLLAARCLLHAASGRAQERLLQTLQPDLIERLLMQLAPEQWSDEPADRLHAGMALVYTALDRIHAAATAAIRRVELGPRRGRGSGRRPRLDRQNLNAEFSRVAGELHLTSEGGKHLRGPHGLTVALAGCERALLEQLRPAASWGALVKSRAPAAKPNELPPEALAIFRRILADPHGLYELFMWMHDARLITALIPEFAAITGRTQRAPLHEVTVDLHTLRVLGALENWRQSERAEDRERVARLDALPRRDLLRLAALLHDIGKSRGDAGHPERGSVMAHDILTRLQFPPEDIRQVRILIEEHLALFNLTTLDPTDRGPFERLARRLETPAMIDRLYLLTIADAQGVAVGALPLWREDRLRALWLSLREQATAGAHPASATTDTDTTEPAPAAAWRETLLAAMPDPAHHRGKPRAELLRLRRQLELHLKAMPARYLTRVSTEDALGHVRLIERLGRSPAVLETKLLSALPAAAGHAVGRLSIATRDRPGRFSQVCAGITGAGLTVVAAEVYERTDGLILDEFRVMPAPAFAAGVAAAAMPAHLAELLREAEALILDILKTPAHAAEIMARTRAHPLLSAPQGGGGGGPAGGTRYEAEVQLMDASHEPLTIVDVRCADRPGLLYALTRAIADLGLNIHFATIDTVRGMATDVFYVGEQDGGNLKDAERRQNLRLLLKAVADHA